MIVFTSFSFCENRTQPLCFKMSTEQPPRRNKFAKPGCIVWAMDTQTARKIAILLALCGHTSASVRFVEVFDQGLMPVMMHTHPTEPFAVINNCGLAVNVHRINSELAGELAALLNAPVATLVQRWNKATQGTSVYDTIGVRRTLLPLSIPSRIFDGCIVTTPTKLDINSLQGLTERARVAISAPEIPVYFVARAAFAQPQFTYLMSQVPMSIESVGIIINPVASMVTERVNTFFASMSPALLRDMYETERLCFAQIELGDDIVPPTSCRVVENPTPDGDGMVVRKMNDDELFTVAQHLGIGCTPFSDFMRAGFGLFQTCYDYRYPNSPLVIPFVSPKASGFIFNTIAPIGRMCIDELRTLVTSRAQYEKYSKLITRVVLDATKTTNPHAGLPVPARMFCGRLVVPLTSQRANLIMASAPTGNNGWALLERFRRVNVPLFELVYPLPLKRGTYMDVTMSAGDVLPVLMSIETCGLVLRVVDFTIPGRPMVSELASRLDSLDENDVANLYGRVRTSKVAQAGPENQESCRQIPGWTEVNTATVDSIPPGCVPLPGQLAANIEAHLEPHIAAMWHQLYYTGEMPVCVKRTPNLAAEHMIMLVGNTGILEGSTLVFECSETPASWHVERLCAALTQYLDWKSPNYNQADYFPK